MISTQATDSNLDDGWFIHICFRFGWVLMDMMDVWPVFFVLSFFFFHCHFVACHGREEGAEEADNGLGHALFTWSTLLPIQCTALPHVDLSIQVIPISWQVESETAPLIYSKIEISRSCRPSFNILEYLRTPDFLPSTSTSKNIEFLHPIQKWVLSLVQHIR